MTPTATGTRAAPAWIVREVTHVPGVLHLEAGRLRFRSSRRVVFDVDLAEAVAGRSLTVPRLRPAGVFDLTVAGERHRVHLTRPPGTTPPAAELLDGLGTTDPVDVDDWQRLLEDARRTLEGRGGRRPVAPTPGAHRRLSPSRWRPARARRGSAGSTPRS